MYVGYCIEDGVVGFVGELYFVVLCIVYDVCVIDYVIWMLVWCCWIGCVYGFLCLLFVWWVDCLYYWVVWILWIEFVCYVGCIDFLVWYWAVGGIGYGKIVVRCGFVGYGDWFGCDCYCYCLYVVWCGSDGIGC